MLCLLFCLPLTAWAEDWDDWEEEEDEWDSLEYWLEEAPGFDNASNATWKTIGAKKGAKLPVYSAPFDDAWRGAKGKAAVSTSEGFRLLGAAQDGRWLMIEYGVDKNSRRVGWIRTPDGTDGDELFEYNWVPRRLLCRVNQKTTFTDDPRASRRKVRELSAGEEVIAMFLLESKGKTYVYAETTVDGKPAWGFIPYEALDYIPLASLDGDRVIVREGVTCIGETGEWWYDEESDESGYISDDIQPGDVWCMGIFLWDDFQLYDASEIILPSTLRSLGGEGIVGGHIGTLRLGGRITRVSTYATYSVDIDRIILAADYTGDVIVGEYTDITAYEVEPGNPRYSSVDGVLFSADRKTLVYYPNGKTDSHYNVPAGTEVIGDRAFTDDGGGLPLTSISLPIGLKKIGKYAFTGCTRLLSLTVPLTVTELDPTAFDTCVSLERLSLPPGLTAEFDHTWAEQGDFTYYNGDNGSTAPNKKKSEPLNEWDEYDARSVSVLLLNPDGENPVPGYRTSTDTIPSVMLPTGTYTSFYLTENGRAKIYVYDPSGDGTVDTWVDLAMLRPYVDEPFFTATDAVPNQRGLSADIWEGNDPRNAQFTGAYYSRNDWITFSIPGGGWDYVTVPANMTTLYREDDGTGRRLGVLCDPSRAVDYTSDVTPVIRLCDAPDGTAAAFAFSGDQVILLEEASGWIHVKTLRAEGWVPAEMVVEALPVMAD